MKTLIYRNQAPIDEFENKLNQAVEKVDVAYQLFRKAPFAPKIFTVIDVLHNLDSIVQAYRLKIVEKEDPKLFSLQGVTFSKNKLAEFIEVNEPPGLRQAVLVANQSLNGINLDHIEIKYNKVVINKALFDKFVDKHSIYASTQKEQIFLDKYEDLGKALEALHKALIANCDIQLLPKPLAPFHIGLWFDLDEKGHYQVKPGKFELLLKRMKK